MTFDGRAAEATRDTGANEIYHLNHLTGQSY